MQSQQDTLESISNKTIDLALYLPIYSTFWDNTRVGFLSPNRHLRSAHSSEKSGSSVRCLTSESDFYGTRTLHRFVADN
jgi:hypothetical protein